MLPTRWKAAYIVTFIPSGLALFNLLTARGIASRLHSLACRRSKQGHRILILAYLNQENASARHRVYKHLKALERAGFQVDVHPPTKPETFNRLFAGWKPAGQYRYFLFSWWNRFRSIWSADRYDAVLIQRSILSEFFYDPPLFIFALKLINPRLIYDFDDALFMLPPHSVRGKSWWMNQLARARFRANVRLSRSVVTSTPYLAQAAASLASNITIIPTPVDVENYPCKEHMEHSPLIIGWTGGGGNLAYLKMIEKPLSRLSKRFPLRLRVVSSRPIKLSGVNVEFVPWSLEIESTNMAQFDVGIMPLADNPYTHGKCGFKLMQYMASGVPAVASPVGVNATIVRQGETGFLASSEKEWEESLRQLISDVGLRRRMGKRSRQVAEKEFSYQTWSPKLVEVLSNTIG